MDRRRKRIPGSRIGGDYSRSITQDRATAPDGLDLDADGIVSDADLAAAPPPYRWDRIGLRGPRIIIHWCTRNALRIAVLLTGLAVLIAGLAMLVLPGPGMLVVLLGLAILATEFAWAERMLDRTTSAAANTVASLSNSRRARGFVALAGYALSATGIFITAFYKSWFAGTTVLTTGLAGLASIHPSITRWLAKRQR